MNAGIWIAIILLTVFAFFSMGLNIYQYRNTVAPLDRIDALEEEKSRSVGLEEGIKEYLRARGVITIESRECEREILSSVWTDSQSS